MALYFGIYDYLVFAATLIVSAAIGVFFAFHKGGQKTTKEFLLGNRKMPVIPTALSILVSFYSGIAVLGFSSEMYMKGTHFFWHLPGVLMGIPLAAYVYQPVFYKLKLTSSYEYLELRFRSRIVRFIGSILYIAGTLMYMAIVLYAPAVALSSVSIFRQEYLIAVIGIVCTFYTTLGGLKAVVYTDAFQAILMYAGLLAVIIQGTMLVGGPAKVWEINKEGGRLITDFSFDPFVYMNFWIVLFGTAIGWMSVYGTSQGSVQRYCSMSSLKKAQLSLLLCIPGVATMVPLFFISGIVMYAYYATCDPLLAKQIHDRDQLLPYFNLDVLGHIAGLPGIFLSCLFSGTLSTISTGLNSLAAVIWEDFLKPLLGHKLSEQQSTSVNKILVLLFGLISIGVAFSAQFFGGVLQGSMTVLSTLGAPVAGLFTDNYFREYGMLGMLFPWANSKGAIAGVLGSVGIMTWICTGTQITKPYRDSLPRLISGCDNETLFAAGLLMNDSFIFNETMSSVIWQNTTMIIPVANAVTNPTLTGISYIYKISYKLYGILGIGLVFIIGIPISLLTGGLNMTELDQELIWPGWHYICCCLPRKVRNKLRPEPEPEFRLRKPRSNADLVRMRRGFGEDRIMHVANPDEPLVPMLDGADEMM